MNFIAGFGLYLPPRADLHQCSIIIITVVVRAGALLVVRAGGVRLSTSVPGNEPLYNVVAERVIWHFLVAREGSLVVGIRGTSCVGIVVSACDRD